VQQSAFEAHDVPELPQLFNRHVPALPQTYPVQQSVLEVHELPEPPHVLVVQ
jgi:hypothetical protein